MTPSNATASLPDKTIFLQFFPLLACFLQICYFCLAEGFGGAEEGVC